MMSVEGWNLIRLPKSYTVRRWNCRAIPIVVILVFTKITSLDLTRMRRKRIAISFFRSFRVMSGNISSLVDASLDTSHDTNIVLFHVSSKPTGFVYRGGTRCYSWLHFHRLWCSSLSLLSFFHIGKENAVAQADSLLHSLNSNSGAQSQKAYRLSMLRSVQQLVYKWFGNNEDFDRELEDLFLRTNESLIHQILRNSCVPLGYILVFFCGNMVPDPSPPPSTNTSSVCPEYSLLCLEWERSW